MKGVRPNPIIHTPTEQQSLDALEQLRTALTTMSQLRQSLTELRQDGFAVLPDSRRLKLQPISRERINDPFHTVPSLTLCGDWLRNAGFQHDHYVRVITLHQLLIICPEEVLPEPGLLKRLV